MCRYVARSAQGQGLGRQLFALALDWMRANSDGGGGPMWIGCEPAVAVCGVCCVTLPPAESGAATRGLSICMFGSQKLSFPYRLVRYVSQLFVVIACTRRKDSSAPASINLRLGLGEMTKLFCERARPLRLLCKKTTIFFHDHEASPIQTEHVTARSKQLSCSDSMLAKICYAACSTGEVAAHRTEC